MPDNIQPQIDALENTKNIINKGEKVRVFYETLMDVLGLSYDNKPSEVMKAIVHSMKEYYDALEQLNGVVQKGRKKLTKKP